MQRIYQVSRSFQDVIQHQQRMWRDWKNLSINITVCACWLGQEYPRKVVSPITDQPRSAFMPVAIVNQFFLKNFLTARQPEDDTGPEIISDGQGLSFCTSFRFTHMHAFSYSHVICKRCTHMHETERNHSVRYLFKKINRDISASPIVCTFTDFPLLNQTLRTRYWKTWNMLERWVVLLRRTLIIYIQRQEVRRWLNCMGQHLE